MPSPQLENGYIRIAVEFWEALQRSRIPGTEAQILRVIIRKTWGFNKKSDRISNGQFCKATGMGKVAVCKAVKGLIDKNIVTKKGNGYVPSYLIQKDYHKWKLLPKKVTTKIVTKKGNAVTKKGNSQLPKMVPTKDTRTKDTLTINNPPLKRRCRIPDNFLLNDNLKTYAIEKNIKPEKMDELFEAFQNYHRSHGTVILDWNRAWYTFVRNAPQFSPWAVKQNNDQKTPKIWKPPWEDNPVRYNPKTGEEEHINER